MDFNQSWVVGVTWEPSFVDEVKGHNIPRSKVIRGQAVRWAQNVKFTSFEKLRTDWNQTWFIDTIWDPLYVHAFKGHAPRSKVIRCQVVRWAQNVKFTSFEKLEVQLEPNLVY